MSAPLPPTFPPPEPRQACRNCGEWLKPDESWYCTDCTTRWGYSDYKKRLAAKARPALAAERNRPWDEWKARKDSGAFSPPSEEGPCPQCGGIGGHLDRCWLQDKTQRETHARLGGQ